MFVKDTRLLNFPDVFLGIPFRFSFFLHGIYQQSLERGRDFFSVFFLPRVMKQECLLSSFYKLKSLTLVWLLDVSTFVYAYAVITSRGIVQISETLCRYSWDSAGGCEYPNPHVPMEAYLPWPCRCSCPAVLSSWFSGTSGHPQSQLAAPSRVGMLSGWVLNISEDGNSTVSLGDLFQCSVTLTAFLTLTRCF